MPQLTVQCKIVISALEKSAEQLKTQNKEEAQTTLKSISKEIEFLNTASQTKESESKYEQKKFTHELSQVIEDETKIRDNSLEIQRSINDLNVEISKEKTQEVEFLNHLHSLQEALARNEAELREHQRNLNELNNKSAESILRSILTLGLDRAIMGIGSLIENDAGRIKSLNEEIAQYKNQSEDDKRNIEIHESLLRELHNKEEYSQSLMLASKQREYELHELEENCRQKLTFFTNVALFYGKLLILLEQVEHRIDDVVDIVDELNDSTPTIIDFDSSEGDLISLKQALEKFDQFLYSEPIKVTIYQDSNYGGASQELSEGDYDVNTLTIGKDQLSSLRVPKGMKVTLFEHGDFTGRSKTFTEDAFWVGDDFNDITSSIKVEMNN